MRKILYVVALVCVVVSCTAPKKENVKDYDKGLVSYFGGDIITMEGTKMETAEAVVANYDEIVFVGSKKEADKLFPKAKPHNLKGNTLMPGFVEPHVHPSLAATMLPNQIIAPYDWVLPTGTKKGVSGEKEYLVKE